MVHPTTISVPLVERIRSSSSRAFDIHCFKIRLPFGIDQIHFKFKATGQDISTFSGLAYAAYPNDETWCPLFTRGARLMSNLVMAFSVPRLDYPSPLLFDDLDYPSICLSADLTIRHRSRLIKSFQVWGPKRRGGTTTLVDGAIWTIRKSLHLIRRSGDVILWFERSIGAICNCTGSVL